MTRRRARRRTLRIASVADATARVAIVADLDAERGEPRGWAMPLHRAPGETGWSTGRWLLRRGHLFLVPGDSPIGLRLPLDSITWTPPPPDAEQSLFAPLEDLPPAPPLVQRGGGDRRPASDHGPVRRGARRARACLPASARGVRPRRRAARRSSRTPSRRAGIQVVIEGYPPPRDNRAQQLVVAPDPGVIEVNIHPSGSWPELAERTLTMVREARRERPRHREVRARRHPHRHRRRQPPDARRPDARRQPAAAPP